MNRLGAVQAFLLGETGPSAGDLGPGEAVNLIAVAELRFRLKAVEVEFVGWSKRRLPDWEDTAHRFCFGGFAAFR